MSAASTPTDWRRRELVTVPTAARLLSWSPRTVRRHAPIQRTAAGPRVPTWWIRQEIGEEVADWPAAPTAARSVRADVDRLVARAKAL